MGILMTNGIQDSSRSGGPTDDRTVQKREKERNGTLLKTRTIAVVILSLFALTLGLGVAELSRRKREAELYLIGRDTISAQVEGILKSPDILRMAARQADLSPGNLELAACLVGPGMCTATDPSHQVPFGLRQGLDPDSAVVIGTEKFPAIYGKKGELNCDPRGSSDCPGWTVRAWFWAECENNEPTCRLAKAVHVRHQVLPLGPLEHLSAEPQTMDLESDPYAFATSVHVGKL
jgi:hypothetical protein